MSDLITGGQNLAMRIQGEYAYNIKIKGCRWNIGAGGANPTDAALATSANWVYTLAAANGIKGGPGAYGSFDHS